MSRRERLEAEIGRLEGTIASLERERSRAPWLMTTALLAIPAAIVWNMFVAAAVLICAISLVGVTIYLTGVRIYEYQGEMEDAKRELARLGQGQATQT